MRKARRITAVLAAALLPLACANNPSSPNNPTPTHTPAIPTFTPTATATPTPTSTSCANAQGTPCTATQSPTPTLTPTATRTSTATLTASPTQSPTETSTHSPTSTVTNSFTPTASFTPTPSTTPTFSPTATRTLTATGTPTMTPTATVPYVWSVISLAQAVSGPTYLRYAGSHLYISDSGNNRVLRVIPGTGFVFQVIGSAGTGGGQFNFPGGLWAKPDESSLWVVDVNNNRVENFNTSSLTYNSFASWTLPPSGSSATGAIPAGGIVVDSNPYLYMADGGDNLIIKTTTSGGWLADLTGPPGNILLHKFAYLSDLTLDNSGFFLAALDVSFQQVVFFNPSGGIIASWGKAVGSTPGLLNLSPTSNPYSGLAVDGSDNVWIADSGNNRVEEFDSNGNFLYSFGTAGSCGSCLNNPSGVALDTAGNIYVSDTGNNRILMGTKQ